MLSSDDVRTIVDLINSRFDDVALRIDDLKRDMIRSAEVHGAEDAKQFDKHDGRLTVLERASWKQAGVISAVNVILIAVWKILFDK